MEHVFTDANFDQEVLKSSVPVLVDFWADWCGPCRMMAPVIEELAQEFNESSMKIGKLNVDQNSQTAGQFNVMSIPMFLVFKQGQVVEQFVGTMTKAAFKEKLSKHV